MTGYRIVPLEPTKEMMEPGRAAVYAIGQTSRERADNVWQAMLAATPRYEITDAEVGRLARIGCESDNSECVGPDCLCWDSQVRETSAALEAFRDGLEER